MITTALHLYAPSFCYGVLGSTLPGSVARYDETADAAVIFTGLYTGDADVSFTGLFTGDADCEWNGLFTGDADCIDA